MNHYVGCASPRRHAAGTVEGGLSFLITVGIVCLVLSALHSLTGCGEQQGLAALAGQPETNAKTSSGPTDRTSGDASGGADEEQIEFVDLDEAVVDAVQADEDEGDALGKDAPQARRVSGETRQAVRGRLLIKFKAGVGEADKHRIIGNANAAVEREIPQIGVKVLRLPEGASETAAMRAFRQRPQVDFVELDHILTPAMIPNDTYYSYEWHLPKIGAPAAWDITTGSAAVIIAILDTGVNPVAELAAKMVPGWNVFDDTADTSDLTGHGTVVAGQAAAITNNSAGVAAVAWGCKIMPVRIVSPSGMGSDQMLAAGLIWAADHGAKVANSSFASLNSQTLASAAQYFSSTTQGVFTLSAGNDGLYYTEPSDPYILRISATGKNDGIPSWSTVGDFITLSAPGESILSVSASGAIVSGSGTSASAPIVAGVAALIVSANPTLTGQQVQDILKQSADDLGAPGWDPSYGWGRVNAGQAVQMARDFGGTPSDMTPPTVSFSSPGGGAVVAGTISIGANAADNVSVASVTLGVDGVDLGTDSASPYSFAWNTTSAANGAHTLRVTARDAAGNSASAQTNVTVDNAAPSVAWTAPAPGAFVAGTAPLAASASDNLSVSSVVFAIDGTTLATDLSAPYSTSWSSTTTSNGAHTLNARAQDMAGNTTSTQISVTVDNAAPTVSFGSPASGATVSGTVSVQVNAGDNLGIASVSVSVDGVLLGTDNTAPYSLAWNTVTAIDGPHMLSTTVRDLAGNTATAQRSVTVSNTPPADDTTPPTITIASPVNGATVSGTVSVTVSRNDNVGVIRVELYVDGALKATSVTSPFTTKWNTRKAAKGGHTLRCAAYDAAGNVGYSQVVTVYK